MSKRRPETRSLTNYALYIGLKLIYLDRVIPVGPLLSPANETSRHQRDQHYIVPVDHDLNPEVLSGFA